MGWLKSLAVTMMLPAMTVEARPAAAETVADWRPIVTEASARFGIPIAWIERVMQAESRGRTIWQGRPITSRAGAMGLMQLMPVTWFDMRTALRLGTDPYDPHDNIVAGAAYLRLLYDRFGYPGLFAAYNAGPGRYGDYLAGRRGLPGETRDYLAAVGGRVATTDATKRIIAATPDRLFVALGRWSQSSQEGPSYPQLFAIERERSPSAIATTVQPDPATGSR